MDLIRVEKLAIVEVLRTLTPSISPIDLRLESSNLQLVRARKAYRGPRSKYTG